MARVRPAPIGWFRLVLGARPSAKVSRAADHARRTPRTVLAGWASPETKP